MASEANFLIRERGIDIPFGKIGQMELANLIKCRGHGKYWKMNENFYIETMCTSTKHSGTFIRLKNAGNTQKEGKSYLKEFIY
jgi:hypothetical protein